MNGRARPVRARGIVDAMNENVVRVRNLRKEYSGRAVVDDVSFDIARGETFALLGPQRRGQVDDGGDPRGVSPPHERRGRACSARIPRPGGLDWKARIGVVLQATGQCRRAHRARVGPPVRGLLPEPARRRRGDRRGRPGGAGGDAHARSSRAGSSDASMSRSASSATPSCCSSTSRRPGSTRRRGGSSGTMIRSLSADGTTILLTTHYLDEAEQLADRVGIIVARAAAGDRSRRRRSAAADARTPIVRWSEPGDASREAAHGRTRTLRRRPRRPHRGGADGGGDRPPVARRHLSRPGGRAHRRRGTRGRPHHGGMNHERHHAPHRDARSTAGRSRVGMGSGAPASRSRSTSARATHVVLHLPLPDRSCSGCSRRLRRRTATCGPAPGLPAVSGRADVLPAHARRGPPALGVQNLAIDIAVERVRGHAQAARRRRRCRR